MRTMKAFLSLLALAGAGIAPALAHHSAQMYNFNRTEQVSGVVKDIRVINPHMTLTLMVNDAKGNHELEFEGHSVNNFYRAGWRPHMVNVGDKIKVLFAPRRDGAEGGYVTGFVTAQGKEIAFGAAPEARRGTVPTAAAGQGTNVSAQGTNAPGPKE